MNLEWLAWRLGRPVEPLVSSGEGWAALKAEPEAGGRAGTPLEPSKQQTRHRPGLLTQEQLGGWQGQPTQGQAWGPAGRLCGAGQLGG